MPAKVFRQCLGLTERGLSSNRSTPIRANDASLSHHMLRVEDNSRSVKLRHCRFSTQLASRAFSSDFSGMNSIAIIGASSDRRKYGNKAVRAFHQQGYAVYPVNPNETAIEGLPAFRSIRDVPVRPEMISVYLPPPVLLKILPDIAARGCDELWLNPGTESDEVLAEAERLGLNVIQACSIVGVGVSPTQL